MTERFLPRLLQAPAIILLLFWMLIPLGMTLLFSFIRYVLSSLRHPEWTSPSLSNWRGLGNYQYVLFNAKDFWLAVQNSVFIVSSVIFVTIVLGIAVAVLVNRPLFGRDIARVLLISPFFIMPAVNAVLWINMILDPVLGLNGVVVHGLNSLVINLQAYPLVGHFFSLWPGIEPISFRATQTSAYAVIIMVSWQWTPFAILIFLTSLQSEDQQQREAAILDGASKWSQFRNLTLPHLSRPIAIVVMIQAIFHLSLYAEIEIVSRGNGNKNLPYLIGEFSANNIGAASATGIFAVILANLIAIFLLRLVGRSLMD